MNHVDFLDNAVNAAGVSKMVDQKNFKLVFPFNCCTQQS